jgi:hypothetical protein
MRLAGLQIFRLSSSLAIRFGGIFAQAFYWWASTLIQYPKSARNAVAATHRESSRTRSR